MKIKKIKIYKTKVVVSFDDDTKIDVDKSVYPNFYFYVGKNVTKKELKELENYNNAASLYNYALKLRSKSLYTEYKMREKLYGKGAKKDQIDFVINKLKKAGLIDDQKYIEEYVDYYNSLNYGKNKIINKLLEKGIFNEMLSRLVFPLDIERKKAKKLLKSYEKKYAKYSDNEKRKHIYQAYIANGFDIGVAKEMTSEIRPSSQKDESDKLIKEFDKVYPKYRVKYSKKELKSKLIAHLANKGFKISDILSLMERKHI